MARYAALLRGVMPTNAKMPELKRAFERGGFTDVKTVLGSGNVVFTTRMTKIAAIERACEAAMFAHLGRSFPTIVRSVEALRELLESDPFANFAVPPHAKRIVTFLREPPRDSKLLLPIQLHGASIHGMRAGEVFSSYLPTPKGPVFMSLIEKTFGKDVTTRTWETVAKIAR
jgi:uncharacterized protein (DUF1697 family)